ncbi:BTB/POZ domain-containing protein POB1 [Acorus gramineus]|uniref:BTB/POZ domain-containing protein POB1 n=1 Tax=Acorus gramineus TaxID=55184 RepID=A0AAV9ALD9_ACOGR|nr:BTB/POZ domain-containing protein POB1 [Acorus gramineus]
MDDSSVDNDTLKIAFNNPLYSDRMLRIEIVEGLQHDDKSSVSPHEKTSKKCKQESDLQVRVEIRHINSLILSQKSKFFHKLFSSGMRESDPQSKIVVRIDSSEEEPFFQLLHHMHGMKSSSERIKSQASLMRLLFQADKFEVPSCISHCVQLLLGLQMTVDSAISVLEMPLCVRMRPDIKPLIDKAEEILAHNFADVARQMDKLENIDMVLLESMLSRDDLRVSSEHEVFDMVLELARSRFPKEELREVLTSLVGRIVRLPYMTCAKLREVLVREDLDRDVVENVVLEALFFKDEPLYRKRALIAHHEESIDRRLVRRAYYMERPIKFVEFERPNAQCIVYLDLTREECVKLSPGDCIRSESFHLLEQKFYISVENTNSKKLSHYFEVYLSLMDGLVSKIKMKVDIAVRRLPCGEFLTMKKNIFHVNTNTLNCCLFRSKDIFDVSCMRYVAGDGPYFINGMLHLRADLTIID